MKATLWILACAALVAALPAQSRPGEGPALKAEKPLPAVTALDTTARLGAAAKRYLDLANASTDPKEAAEFMKLYEEKERAIAEIRKEAEAERKGRETITTIRGWSAVADEAHERGIRAADDAQQAADSEKKDRVLVESKLKGAQIDLTDAREAESRAMMLQSDSGLGVAFQSDAALYVNRTKEKVRLIEEIVHRISELLAGLPAAKPH